jgi:hypothetical protein
LSRSTYTLLSTDLETNVTLCVFHFILTVWRTVRIVNLSAFFLLSW